MEDDIAEKIQEEVHRAVTNYFNDNYDSMYEIQCNIKEQSHDIFANQKRVMDRINEIEKLINSHAIGVQNVYNSIQDLRDKYDNLSKTSKSYRKIVELMEDIKKPENIELLNILSSLDYNLLQNISCAAEYLNDLEKIKKIFKT